MRDAGKLFFFLFLGWFCVEVGRALFGDGAVYYVLYAAIGSKTIRKLVNPVLLYHMFIWTVEDIVTRINQSSYASRYQSKASSQKIE